MKKKQEQMLQSAKFNATALVNDFNNMSMGDLDKTANPYAKGDGSRGGGRNTANEARVNEYMTQYKSLDLRLTVLHEECEDAK